MKFTIDGTGDTEFEIPDSWWKEAEMDTFVRRSSHYPPNKSALEVIILQLKSIDPRKRNPGVPDFVEARMINILKGIRLGKPIDPIIVNECSKSSQYAFLLKDGYHRLRASIACGFTDIPAIIDVE